MKTHAMSLLSMLPGMGVTPEVAGPAAWEHLCDTLGIEYHFLPINDGFDPMNDMKVLWGLGRILSHQTYSLLHVHGAKAALLSRLVKLGFHGPKVVYTLHGFLVRPGMSTWQKALYPIGERVLAPFTEAYIAVSRAVMEDFCHRTGMQSIRGFEIIHNGVDPQAFVPGDGDTVRKHLGLGGAPVIGTMARLVPEKGVHIFLEAASLLHEKTPDIRFLIVGDGPLRPHLECLARRLNLQNASLFTGQVRDPREILKVMDIVVLPSVSEGMSVVALEAMASGKPVVAAKTGGIPEVIKAGKNGLLFTPGEASDLAGALETLAGNAAMRKRMGDTGREYAVRYFNIMTMARRTLRVYHNVVSQGKGLPR